MLSDEYIVGLTEGEGCFAIGVKRYVDRRPRLTGKRNNMVKRKREVPFRVMPSFRMTLSDKDRAVLEKLKEKFGGNVYLAKQQKGNSAAASQYYIQSIEGLKKIRAFFENQTFHTTKKRDFELWCQCLDIFFRGDHLNPEGFLEICRLRDQMNRKKMKWVKRFADELAQITAEKPEHIQAHQKLIHNSDENSENTHTTP